MYKIDNLKAALALPAPAAVGPNPNGFFGEHTLVTSDWLNALQEEICYVITNAGFSLDKSDNTQLYTAIAHLIDLGSEESGISEVEEDTSPALGGDLVVNGFKFNSASNGDVQITVSGAAGLYLDAATVLIHTNIYHSGDLDNYIQFGTDTLNFVTNNTSKLDINASGLRIGGGGVRVTTCYNDSSMTADSDTALTSQAAFKAYVDAKLASVQKGSVITSFIDISSHTSAAVDLNAWDFVYTDDVSLSGPIPNRFVCTRAGTIKNFYGYITCRILAGVLTSNTTSCTLTVYKNDVATTLTYFIASGQARDSIVAFAVTGVNLTVVAGDYIYIRLRQGTGASNTNQQAFNGTISLEYAF